MKEINLEGLKKEIQFKFKPQSVKFGKALMVTYIDSRDVQDLLDECVGPENWQDDYKVVNENMFAGISINVTGDPLNPKWVTKFDCGTESNQDAEKGESSDAFKRAAVKWGIGRFLYRQGVIELKAVKDTNGKERPATDEGKVLWNNDQITEYIRTHKLKNTEAKEPSASNKTTREERYQKPTETPTYTTTKWSPEVVDKVKILTKNGKTGKDCLKEFLPKFNEVNKTSYKVISELNTDELLTKLMTFIEDLPPEGI